MNEEDKLPLDDVPDDELADVIALDKKTVANIMLLVAIILLGLALWIVFQKGI